MVNTMGWNERSDPDMRTANFCDVYREGVYTETNNCLLSVLCNIYSRRNGRLHICKKHDANFFPKGFIMHFELVKMYWRRNRKINS